MSAVVIALAAMALFYLAGYHWWSRRIAENVLGIDPNESTPAHDPELQDGIDYVPTQREVLWGHHYSSIAGAAPIIGPAVAVIWGWLPALVWIVFGTIFIGAVHDFSALVLSARKRGTSMADIAGEVIHPRVRVLFQIVIYFLIWIVLAVFGFAIGVLFDHYPASVIPVNAQIIVAVAIGLLVFKRNTKILIPSLIALVLLYAIIPFGIDTAESVHSWVSNTSAGLSLDVPTFWAIILLIYAGIASVLPVWLLLQPRDYINSHLLIVGLVLLLLGLFVMNPSMQAPPINANPEGAPPLFPLLFVTIACGAISGFHGLVSSGTTSKQLNKMSDARAIGYGGMLGEGMLAVIATIAVAAGLKNWDVHYHQWNESGVKAIARFVEGSGVFLNALTIPMEFATAVVAILAICFAATSMDTAARIQRFIVTELGRSCGIRALENRYLATAVAVLPAIPLVMAGQKAWAPLWLLFGTTNQLIGGITLLVLFVYLYRAKRPLMPIALPMIFVIVMTTGAMVFNLYRWVSVGGANTLTITLGSCILLLELWMIVEAVIIVKSLRQEHK